MDYSEWVPRGATLTDDGTLILSFFKNAEFAAMDRPPSEAYVRVVLPAMDVAAMCGKTENPEARLTDPHDQMMASIRDDD